MNNLSEITVNIFSVFMFLIDSAAIYRSGAKLQSVLTGTSYFGQADYMLGGHLRHIFLYLMSSTAPDCIHVALLAFL